MKGIDQHNGRELGPSIQPFVYWYDEPHHRLVSIDEDPVRQHSHAPTENNSLLEMLGAKSKECDRLTHELETLKKQTQQDTNVSVRVIACE